MADDEMSFVGVLVAIPVFLFSLCFALAITQPLVGALVRYRAHFTPRGLQLDSEGGVQPHVGPVISGYFGMLMRVKRIEGWQGLYKGVMPTLLTSLLITFFAVLQLGISATRVHHGYSVPRGNYFQVVIFAGFLAILTTPFTVLINRCITTPHKLPYLAPRASLRLILTDYERQRPWSLYLTPGLLLARVLHITWIILVQRFALVVLVPSLADHTNRNRFSEVSPVWLTIYLIFTFATHAGVLTPLEVVATRLSIQRNNPDLAEANVEVEYAGADEDVIALRPEDDPYYGFRDCAERIMNEEGIGALYRAWWLTMLGGLGGI